MRAILALSLIVIPVSVCLYVCFKHLSSLTFDLTDQAIGSLLPKAYSEANKLSYSKPLTLMENSLEAFFSFLPFFLLSIDVITNNSCYYCC